MKFLSVCFKKLRAMAGGGAFYLLLPLAVLLCCAAVHAAVYSPAPAQIALLVLDEDTSPESAALTEALLDTEGLVLSSAGSESAARRALALGRTEGLLIIGEGFADALRADAQDLCLHYESSPLSHSSQAVREIIAGKASVLRAQARAYTDAESLLGTLTDADRAVLEAYLEAPAPQNYTIRMSDGSSAGMTGASAAFTARWQGFVSLAVLLGMLCLSAFLGRADARRVARRMASLPGGRLRNRAADAGALFFGGLMMTIAALLPAGVPEWREALAFLCYLIALTGICLRLGLWSRSGRANVLAPFLVLITGLVGGCFMDLSALSPTLSALSLLTPQGLLLAALSGSAFALPVLLAVGALGLGLSCIE